MAAAVAGLVLGLLALRGWPAGFSASLIWSVGTLPVLLLLAWSIFRDLLNGRFGVDAIAFVSMAAALAIGEALAAVIVAIMYAGGTVLEDFARARSTRALRALGDRAPRFAHRSTGEMFDTVPVGSIGPGDRLVVLAGEIVPVDGRLIDSSASIDKSAVTGEPLPELRRAGEILRSGTVNAGDPFSMTASATASESTYSGIVRLVEAAQLSKSPMLRLADRAAIVMLPLTLAIAALAWGLSADVTRAVAVLVVATPCPLILAAPIAFLGGISKAARSSVLIKGGTVIESLAEVRTAVFDKTGTLTRGGAELLEIETSPGRSAKEMLRVLASIEQASRHAVAHVVVECAKREGAVLSLCENVKEKRGAGLEGLLDGVSVRAGSLTYVLDGQQLPSWATAGQGRYSEQPVGRVAVSISGRLEAIFTFGDPIRGDAAGVLAELHRLGVARLIMLTGDDWPTARRVARDLPFDEVVAEAEPADKVALLRKENESAPTMMVGDGLNDAPALATASVGVALGARGATASSEAADAVILSDQLAPLVHAIEIARQTRKIAWQSVVMGLALSGMAMVAAAFGLIQPVLGALLQEAIDIGVIANALRALR